MGMTQKKPSSRACDGLIRRSRDSRLLFAKYPRLAPPVLHHGLLLIRSFGTEIVTKLSRNNCGAEGRTWQAIAVTAAAQPCPIVYLTAMLVSPARANTARVKGFTHAHVATVATAPVANPVKYEKLINSLCLYYKTQYYMN